MSGSWKVAYADFMTAMMAFFLLMWILNMAPKETVEGLAEYFTEGAIGISNQSSSMKNSDKVLKLDKLDTTMTDADKTHYAIAQLLKEALSIDSIPANSTGVSSTQVGVLLHITGDVMFEPNSVVLAPSGMKVLDEVVKVMNKYNVLLVVRGHASKDEDGKPNYPSKWELSAARATSTIRYLTTTGGIDQARMRSTAYADTRPLVPDTSSDASMRNRRVEFYFHRPEVMSSDSGY